MPAILRRIWTNCSATNTVLLLHADGSGNLFTDDSYTTGKQTQLHGWAVNY